MEIQPEVVSLACEYVGDVCEDWGFFEVFFGVGDGEDAGVDGFVEDWVGVYGFVEIFDYVLEFVL